MPPQPDWAWPTCLRAWRNPSSQTVVSNGCSRAGAFRIQATTYTTRATGSTHARSPCWSTRCATGRDAGLGPDTRALVLLDALTLPCHVLTWVLVRQWLRLAGAPRGMPVF